MEKIHNLTYYLILSSIFPLSVLASVFCIVAEFKKSKVDDLKMDGKLCKLERSEAYGIGMGALMCFLTAQIVGNLVVFMGIRRSFCPPKTKTPTIFTFLLLISWLSFGIAVMLLSTAISMNQSQAYGKGWFDGECYLVKDGVFIGASILVLLSLTCTLTPIVTAIRKQLLQVSVDQKAKGVFVPVR